MANWSAMFGGGGRTPAAIVNAWSGGGVVAAYPVYQGSNKLTLSGAVSAGVLVTALNLTGAGVLKICAVQAQDATARTMRLKVTLDGVAVFDATTASSTTASGIQLAVGHMLGPVVSGGIYTLLPDRVHFNSSCLVEIASSLGETNKIGLLSTHEVF